MQILIEEEVIDKSMEELIQQLIDKIEGMYIVGQISYGNYKDLMGLARTLQIEK